MHTNDDQTPETRGGDEAEEQSKDQPSLVQFDYLKSSLFRVMHVDGVHGGISPRGQIQMALFNERLAIPRQTVHELTAAGALGKEVVEARVQRKGIVREVEAELLMSIDTAKSVVGWLKERIEQLEEIHAQAMQRGQEHGEA
jgi:hypothetical protein